MPAKPTKPPKFPVLQALMDWHIEHETNGAVLAARGNLQGRQGEGRAQAYRAGLSAAYGKTESTFNRICGGNSRPGRLGLLRALGYKAGGQVPATCQDADTCAQAEWEFIAACGEPPQPALYRADLDAKRARLAERFADALAAHLPAPASPRPTMPARSQPHQPGGQPSAATGAATASARTVVQREAVRRLAEPGCAAWLPLLAQECEADAPPGPRPSAKAIGALVSALRGLGMPDDRQAPLDAIARSLGTLRRQQGTLDTDSLAAVRAAAHALFALCLMDCAVAIPAALAADQQHVLAPAARELLEAVVLLDDALGHATEFERVAPNARQPARLVQVAVRDVMTDADHAPGLLPGRAGEATRQQIAGWALPFFEASDAGGLGHSDASESLPVSDADLRQMLRTLARQHGRYLRAALDLAAPDAPARLELLRQQARQFGLPSVAYGGNAEADDTGLPVAAPHAEAPALPILVAAFLKRLEDLSPPASDTRRARSDA